MTALLWAQAAGRGGFLYHLVRALNHHVASCNERIHLRNNVYQLPVNYSYSCRRCLQIYRKQRGLPDDSTQQTD